MRYQAAEALDRVGLLARANQPVGDVAPADDAAGDPDEPDDPDEARG